MWKIVTEIMNCRQMLATNFHDAHHSLHTGNGRGKASLESMILQQMISMSKEVLYKMFLYLYKA